MNYILVDKNYATEPVIQLRLSTTIDGLPVLQARSDLKGNWLHVVTFTDKGEMLIDKHDYCKHLGITVVPNARFK